MKYSVKITLILLFVMLIPFEHAQAFNLDESVDDDIRKNYNSTKLIQDVGIRNDTFNSEEELPALPTTLKTTKTQKTTAAYTNRQRINVPLHKAKGHIKLSKGTSFDVTSTTAISDSNRAGTTVRFKLKSTKSNLIPPSAVFVGKIIDSHSPQITCNGGLVVIQLEEIVFNGERYGFNGYVTRANDKKIFFNNIKGKRTYLKTVYKKGAWGRTMFGKMMTLTVNLGKDGSTLLLSPFPLAYGTICFGANTLISPITAFFNKGGRLTIPAGSNFRIKLENDTWIN